MHCVLFPLQLRDVRPPAAHLSRSLRPLCTSTRSRSCSHPLLIIHDSVTGTDSEALCVLLNTLWVLRNTVRAVRTIPGRVRVGWFRSQIPFDSPNDVNSSSFLGRNRTVLFIKPRTENGPVRIYGKKCKEGLKLSWAFFIPSSATFPSSSSSSHVC